MMDFSPPPKLWFPKPGIIRAASMEEVERASRRANFLPGMAGVAGAMGRRGAPFSWEWVAGNQGTGNTLTWNDQAFGAVAAGRFHVLAVARRRNEPTLVRVGGIDATHRVGTSGSNGSSQARIYTIEGVTGTSGSVQINSGGTASEMVSWSLYRLVNASSVAPTATLAASGSSTAPTGTLNVPAGGIVIATAYVQRSANNHGISQASREYATAQSPLTVTATSNTDATFDWTGVDEDFDHQAGMSIGSNAAGMAAAAWGPG